MNYKKILSSAILPILLISACSPTGGTSSEPAMKTPDVKVETPVVPERAFVRITEATTTDLDSTLGYFVMSFDLQSDAGQPDKEYGDFSPAMPLLSTSFAIYLDDGSYKFLVNKADGSSDSITVGSAEDWTSVRLVNLADGATLFVNGDVVLTSSRLRPLKTVTTGKGFKSRYWTGKLADFRVCSAASIGAAITAPEAMMCADAR